MNSAVNIVLLGALTMSCCVVALFFVRFWTLSRDRFFLFFAGAFLLLALNWLSLAVTQWSHETQHQLFLVRPLAFLLIVAAVVDKNRRAGAGSPQSKNRKSVGT
jgi:hypothetical protein